MRSLRRSSLRMVIAALLGVGCGGGSDVTAPPSGRPVASVAVTPSPTSVAVAQTLQLTAVTKASDGSTLTGRTVTWATSNPAIATVSATGLVTGVAVGTVTVTATSEKVSGTATVAVTATKPLLRTWVGGATPPTDWSVAGNWTPAGVPAPLDTARVPAVPNAPVLSHDVQLARLIVAGGTLRTAGHVLTVKQP